MSRYLRNSLAALAIVAVLAMPTASFAQTDTERERDRVQERQDEVEGEIDVLRASNAEVQAELRRIDGEVAAQEAAVADAQEALSAARAVEAEAAEALAVARADLEVLRQAVQDMAVASYIHPPTQDLVESLAVADFSDALIARSYLDARAKRDVNLLRLFREAEDVAETRAQESHRATEAATSAATTAQDALGALQAQRAQQQHVVATVGTRIDAALAESAALADLDAELSAKIAAEQQALIDALPPQPATVPASSGDSVPATPTPGTPSTPPPPTTIPPPPPGQETPPLATVHGITVHASIAGQVSNMIEAAAAAGVTLSGSGYRSTQRQIELRIINGCPDVWTAPSWSCRVPTARPGLSLHEKGLAIDFVNCSTRATACYLWLAENAGRYGLKNFPVEPWHWSTTGG